MADQFLEEVLPIGVRAGARIGDDFDVEIVEDEAGNEYRRLVHPYPRRTWTIQYTDRTAALWDAAVALYYRAYRSFAGFRVRPLDDYSTNGRTGTPTATDCAMALVSAGVYQLQAQYGAGATPITIGLPLRTVFKPVSGTVKVGVGGVALTLGWSVDTTTGRVTFAADKTRSVTGITQAAQAVLTVGAHTFVVGETVHVSGVSGMTEINGLRGTITATGGTTITLDINSSAFSVYTSGGVAHTNPQAGEAVTGGCEFDIPARFNSRLDLAALAPGVRETSELEIVELLNP